MQVRGDGSESAGRGHAWCQSVPVLLGQRLEVVAQVLVMTTPGLDHGNGDGKAGEAGATESEPKRKQGSCPAGSD